MRSHHWSQRSNNYFPWILAAWVAAGCAPTGTSPYPTPTQGKDTVALVNGFPITTADVELALRKVQHAEDLPKDARKTIIDNLIREELVRQEAIKKGLDKAPEQQEKYNQLVAPFMAALRAELADAYFAREIAANATVSDAEARAYFDSHASQLRSEYHILQILIRKDDASMEQARLAIAGGATFEEVAAKRFGKLPPGIQRPWDLGYLRWSQLPAEWQTVMETLQPGAVSPVIRGAGQRAWILKLVDKRESASISFDTEKPIVLELLQRSKVDELRARSMDELRKSAKITIPNP